MCAVPADSTKRRARPRVDAWRVAFASCALLALLAVWGHRFPAGVDLPQHANLFRVGASFSDDALGFRHLFRIEPFTPYLLTCAVGVALTVIFGALVAAKVLIAFSAVATPWLLARWLRAVGGEPWLGLLGFAVVFGFAYVWGLLSFLVALPLVVAYLLAFEEQQQTSTWRKGLLASGLALLLLSCHLVACAFALAVSGLRCALQARRWRHMLRSGAHALPALAVLGVYLGLTARPPMAPSAWLNTTRLTGFFSGLYSVEENTRIALYVGGGLAVLLLPFGPRPSLDPRRLLPFAVALLAFLGLPEWLSGTFLTASRFSVLAQLFLCGLVVPRAPSSLLRVARALLLITVAGWLILLNLRLSRFNEELAGLDELRLHVKGGAATRSLIVETNPHSPSMGPYQHAQTAAWMTALRAGYLENDYGSYFQMPIRRRPSGSWLDRYDYIVTRGPAPESALESSPVPSYEVARSGDFRLYRAHHDPILFPGGRVLRSAQGWGQLLTDRAVTGRPLTVAGKTYPRGLGGHANAVVQVALEPRASWLRGAVALDDGAGGSAPVTFRVLDHDRHVLFDSGPMRAGDLPREFALRVKPGRNLALEARVAPGHGNTLAHVDWLDLRAE